MRGVAAIRSGFLPKTPAGPRRRKTLPSAPLSTVHLQVSLSPPPSLLRTNSTNQRDLLVETYHQNQALKSLIRRLSNKDQDPLHVISGEGGDLNADQFSAVVKFLGQTHRIEDALQVFGVWKSREQSRINENNYAIIIRMLVGAGKMEEAVSMLQEMENDTVTPSLRIYNNLIHGLGVRGDFKGAKSLLKKMEEVNLVPVAETFHGLIQAYGDHRMYDEMSKCAKKMESMGCPPDVNTYNVLIREYARGLLIERMEKMCRTVLSKRIMFQPSTLKAMLEAYMDLGMLEKMEKVLRRILNSGVFLEESLIRRVAVVYIKNYRFCQLEEFGQEISSITGRTELVWCLLLLASACLLSRRGMDSICREMEAVKFRQSISFVNTIALAYLKMKDFRNLDDLLSQLGAWDLKPDIVTVGVIFDAVLEGYDGKRAFETWRRKKFLKKQVEMRTDPLVLTAFGKGSFLRSCEEFYSSIGSKAMKKKVWTYNDLISFVSKTKVAHTSCAA
ncbi:Pentatricopeptide repeat-containing protein [Acorus gramineus]|uniref:Pentatricopeptide repeat-containing protein n=1 Tax=Acorus gramineus TaxID=55184 RepID=A0AAV9A5H4_ACOGR|nr:Pentatricopeptide repeat-containing protein [Acorus gramineus]